MLRRFLHPERPAGPTLPNESGGPAPLATVPTGTWLIVDRIDGPAREELEREGLIPGTQVLIAARTPLGGPLLVDVGRARIALSSDVARSVLTRPVRLLPEP
jgi:Fe2+ transport system protein FeoA